MYSTLLLCECASWIDVRKHSAHRYALHGILTWIEWDGMRSRFAIIARWTCQWRTGGAHEERSACSTLYLMQSLMILKGDVNRLEMEMG
jgi:hypothetical protein